MAPRARPGCPRESRPRAVDGSERCRFRNRLAVPGRRTVMFYDAVHAFPSRISSGLYIDDTRRPDRGATTDEFASDSSYRAVDFAGRPEQRTTSTHRLVSRCDFELDRAGRRERHASIRREEGIGLVAAANRRVRIGLVRQLGGPALGCATRGRYPRRSLVTEERSRYIRVRRSALILAG